jgi:cytochrome c oxidase subunit 2
MEIHVIAKQWMWKIQHPNGRREINELHIPINRAVKLVLTSQDVIHDFFIPDFRVKQDVLPGRYTTEWFKAVEPGEYHFFCAQYCGAQHARMRGLVIAMEPQAYQDWLAHGNNGAEDQRPQVLGQRAFIQFDCYTCHGVRSPTVAGLYGTTVQLADGRTVLADDNYLRESILDPAAKIVAGYTPIMPSYKGLLSEEQIFDLIAYIKSLKDAQIVEPFKPLVMPGQSEIPTTLPTPSSQEIKP